LLAGFATVVTLLIGFPTALYIALKEEKTRQRLILLISIPFWTNLLVRTYAWMLLLRNGGLIDSSLSALGLSQGALDVLYTPRRWPSALSIPSCPSWCCPFTPVWKKWTGGWWKRRSIWVPTAGRRCGG
jgi:ABC-type spermidine/putrescine transport system permease subunit I